MMMFSLCNLGVLRVSVVNDLLRQTNHRDTENTEVAQRNPDDMISSHACQRICRKQ